MRSRAEIVKQIEHLTEKDTPIVIVGGGINGIGLYRDLALQKIPAILIDKSDFSSGTSAAPSRLIHGGLRYLETGEFELVRESVVERNHLMRNAPHLVKTIPVWVPTFSWVGGLFSAGLRFLKLKKTPGAKGIFVVKIGLMFFDQFGRKNQTTPRHRLISRNESRAKMPSLSPKIRAVAEYFDARLVHPERLALELVKDAELDCPEALAVPYMSLQETQNDRIILKDEISGKKISLRPSLVVNCTGPWVDEVNKCLMIDKRLIGGTRGSHLLLERPDLAAQLGDGMLYFETEDFRACLIYALDANTVLLGTTDIRDEDPDAVQCSDEEIDYLFDVLNQVMPDANAKKSEITFAYSGMRPLPYSGDSTTGSITRDHALRSFEADSQRHFPVLTLIGGKWTTYRACAEQICDVILERINKPRKSSTLSQAIGGGKNMPEGAIEQTKTAESLAAQSGIDPIFTAKLLKRYGMTASDVAASVKADGLNPIAKDAAYYRGEILWILKNERVTRLSDIILRRTLLPFENGATRTVITEIANIAANELGWNAERRNAEIKHTIDLLVSKYRVQSISSS